MFGAQSEQNTIKTELKWEDSENGNVFVGSVLYRPR